MPLVPESRGARPGPARAATPVAPGERLNGGLLVLAEHRGMTGRVHVEPDDVGRLGLEVGGSGLGDGSDAEVRSTSEGAE